MQTFRKCLCGSNNFVSQLPVGVSFGLHNRVQRAQIRSRRHRSRSSRCRATLDTAVPCSRPNVELISTLDLVVQRDRVGLHDVEPHSTVLCVAPGPMSNSYRHWVWCNVQPCRVGLHDVELHSTVLCVAPGPMSSSYRHWVWCNVQRCRVGLHDVELHSTVLCVAPAPMLSSYRHIILQHFMLFPLNSCHPVAGL